MMVNVLILGLYGVLIMLVAVTNAGSPIPTDAPGTGEWLWKPTRAFGTRDIDCIDGGGSLTTSFQSNMNANADEGMPYISGTRASGNTFPATAADYRKSGRPSTSSSIIAWEGCCLMEGTPLASDILFQGSSITAVTVIPKVFVHNEVGTDTSTCGATESLPCKSIKWGFHNRLQAGGTLLVLFSNTYYTGYDNMDLYVPGGTAANIGCTRASMDFTIEGKMNSLNQRPVVDLEFKWSFIQIGRPGAPLGGKNADSSYSSYAINPAAYEGKASVKGLVFHRGKAPPNTGYFDGPSNSAPAKSFWGIYLHDYQGINAEYTPDISRCASPVVTNIATWSQTTVSVTDYSNNTDTSVVTPAPRSDVVTTSPTQSSKMTVCPRRQYKMGCGSVSQVYGAEASVTTFHNCDFKYGIALIGGALCVMGRGQVIIKGDPWLVAGQQVGAGNNFGEHYKNYTTSGPLKYQDPVQDDLTGSYCNFERNNAYGPDPARFLGAGGAIFWGWRPYIDGFTGTSNLTISGCNFFRQLAYNWFLLMWGSGGVIATSGGPGFNLVINQRSSFYENWAQRGGVLSDIGSTNFLQGNTVPGKPYLKSDVQGYSNFATGWAWGFSTTIKSSYFKRQGWFDLEALFGCNGNSENCTNANNEGFNAPGGAMNGLDDSGSMAAIFKTFTEVKAAMMPREKSVFEAKDSTDYAWPLTAPTWFIRIIQPLDLDYGGSPGTNDPMISFPCKGFDQYGDGPSEQILTSGAGTGTFGTYYSPYIYPRPYFEHCGSPGTVTRTWKTKVYGGSMPFGVVTSFGAVIYLVGGAHAMSIRDSKFVGNRARVKGSVMIATEWLTWQTGSKDFINCEFVRNSCVHGGALQMFSHAFPSALLLANIPAGGTSDRILIEGCKFIANIARWRGGQ